VLLEEITMIEFEEGLGKTRTIIIPFGSIEEHGSHLPLLTDTIHIYEVAKEVAKVIPVYVAPPIYYGMCRSTKNHAGTVSISGNTLRGLTRDIIKSLYDHGMRSFILLSGHAGGTHMSAILEGGEWLLEKIPAIRVAVVSILDLVKSIEGGIIETKNDSHAGEVETSLMLFLSPHLVKGRGNEEYPSFPKPILVRDKKRFWPGGIWGDPTKASKQKGERIFRHLVKEVVELVKRIEAWED
jgi:creatinine amidohydrolase